MFDCVSLYICFTHDFHMLKVFILSCIPILFLSVHLSICVFVFPYKQHVRLTCVFIVTDVNDDVDVQQ